MSRDVLAFLETCLSIYKAARFYDLETGNKKVAEQSVVKNALFCGDCCDRNQAIILVVLVVVSL